MEISFQNPAKTKRYICLLKYYSSYQQPYHTMPRTRSATILALSWQGKWCSHTNNTTKNKKRCFSCQAWRNGIAPLSMQVDGDVCNKASGVGNVGGNAAGGVRRVGLVFCSSKNDSTNEASPCKVKMSPEKNGENRKSPS